MGGPFKPPCCARATSGRSSLPECHEPSPEVIQARPASIARPQGSRALSSRVTTVNLGSHWSARFILIAADQTCLPDSERPASFGQPRKTFLPARVAVSWGEAGTRVELRDMGLVLS